MTERQRAADVEVATPAAGRRGEEVRTGREAADELPWVDDRVSKLWVALIAGVFGAILLYGILLGDAGLLTPVASPSPSPGESPISSPTAPSSPTPRPSVPGSPASSPSPGRSPTSTAPASPSRAPSPAASPSPTGS